MIRCPWVRNSNQLYLDYHDKEWGVPVYDDIIQFEFLVLESAQAGLSWLTVLKKRDSYRKAFDNFNPQKVASYDSKKILSLMNNEGIIRNKLKIEAAINNAQRFIEIQSKYGSFSSYIWHFTEGKPLVNYWKEMKEIPAKTKLSDIISLDLKKKGFKFLGSIIVYSHLQATGIVNDHIIDCFRFKELTNSMNSYPQVF